MRKAHWEDTLATSYVQTLSWKRGAWQRIFDLFFGCTQWFVRCCKGTTDLATSLTIFQDQIGQFVVNSKLIPLLVEVLKDTGSDFSQSSYALIGDLSRYCPEALIPHLNDIIPLLLRVSRKNHNTTQLHEKLPSFAHSRFREQRISCTQRWVTTLSGPWERLSWIVRHKSLHNNLSNNSLHSSSLSSRDPMRFWLTRSMIISWVRSVFFCEIFSFFPALTTF